MHLCSVHKNKAATPRLNALLTVVSGMILVFTCEFIFIPPCDSIFVPSELEFNDIDTLIQMFDILSWYDTYSRGKRSERQLLLLMPGVWESESGNTANM